MEKQRNCNNEDDPITLDPIAELEDKYLIEVPCGNITNCYDIRSLGRWVDEGNEKDPLCGNPMSRATINLLNRKRAALGVQQYGEVRAERMEENPFDIPEPLPDYPEPNQVHRRHEPDVPLSRLNRAGIYEGSARDLHARYLRAIETGEVPPGWLLRIDHINHRYYLLPPGLPTNLPTSDYAQRASPEGRRELRRQLRNLERQDPEEGINRSNEPQDTPPTQPEIPRRRHQVTPRTLPISRMTRNQIYERYPQLPQDVTWIELRRQAHNLERQSQAEIRPNEPSDTLLTQPEIPRQTQNSPTMRQNQQRYSQASETEETHESPRLRLTQRNLAVREMRRKIYERYPQLPEGLSLAELRRHARDLERQSQAEIRPNEPSDTLLTQQEIPRQTQNSPTMLPNLERYQNTIDPTRMSLRQLLETYPNIVHPTENILDLSLEEIRERLRRLL